jgi:hypothetical protein
MRLQTLNTLNQATNWIDLRSLIDGFEFQIAVTGSITVTLESANDETYGTKADSVAVESFSTSVARIVELPLSKFMRFKVTVVAGGSAVISSGRGKNRDGDTVEVSFEPYVANRDVNGF